MTSAMEKLEALVSFVNQVMFPRTFVLSSVFFSFSKHAMLINGCHLPVPI